MDIRRRLCTLFRSTSVLLLIAAQASAVTLGQIDDFQAGTVAGWGGGAPTSNAADAGPAGAGDRAMRVAALSTGRVAVVNTAQWTGDFAAAGITKLVMDIRNENAFALQMRLGLAKGVVGSGGAGDTYVSAAAVAVPGDGQWHRIALNASAAAFIPHAANSNPAPDAGAALAAVSHFRILHNGSANFLGGNGPASFLLDNIQAVPEPSWVSLGLIAFAAVSLRRRPAQRSSR